MNYINIIIFFTLGQFTFSQQTVSDLYMSQLKRKSIYERNVKSAYIQEFGKTEDLLNNSYLLFLTIENEINSDLKNNTEVELRDIFPDLKLISPDIDNNILQMKINTNAAILRGPIRYDINEDEIRKAYKFKLKKIEELKPFITKITSSIYIVNKDKYFKLTYNGKVISKIDIHYAPETYLSNLTSIGDFVQIGNHDYIPSTKKIMYGDIPFIDMHNEDEFFYNYTAGNFNILIPRTNFRSNAASLDDLKLSTDNVNLIKHINSFAISKHDTLYEYTTKLYNNLNPTLTTPSKLFSNLPFLDPIPERGLGRLQIYPNAILMRIKNALGENRYTQMVNNKEKLMLWLVCDEPTGYVKSILIGTYKNTSITYEEINSLLNAFNKWTSKDFLGGMAKNEGRYIFDFSNIPNISNYK